MAVSSCMILLICYIFSYASTDNCDPGWVESGSFCFRFSNVKLSWSDAINECRNLDSVLLRLYSQDDKNSFLNASGSIQETRWWTDLNNILNDGAWKWGTGSLAVNAGLNDQNSVVVWNTEPDDTSHLENCGAVNIQGAISDERCSEKHGFICEQLMPQGIDCSYGWQKYNNSCYQVSDVTDPWSLYSWYDAANQSCIQGGTSSHLLNLETTDEIAFLRRILPVQVLSSQLWWIGLNDIQKERTFVWTDGSAAQTNTLPWANEPNNLGGGELCAVIYRNGRFADLNCTQAEKYICMKDKRLTTPVTNRLGCPSGWTRAGRSCYLISQKVKKWSDAVSDCSNYGASILKVDSKDEKKWLEVQTKYWNKGLWTGLNYNQQRKVWIWADQSTPDDSLLNWNQEPNDYSSGEDCATISQGLTFNDDPCSKPNGFICEAQTEDMGCPPNWQTQFDEDESTCYFISNYTADWNEARAECGHLSFPIDSYLLAINSQDELDYINKLVLGQKPSGIVWFTGLNDIQNEGQWTYNTEFNNPPDMTLIHWKGSPQFINGRENCALVFYGGRYTNIDCDAQIPYICEKPAIITGKNGLSSSVESRRGGLTYLVTLLSTLLLGKLLKN